MKGKKRIVSMMVVLFSLVLSACFVYANPREITFDIVQGVTIRFKNEIHNGRLSAYAETHSTDQTTQTYVNATFYYVDYEHGQFGTTNRSQGSNGGSQVSVGPNTFPNITEYYYQVVSNHMVTHSGLTMNADNLTSYAP